jgi:peptidoglycan-associated lipoprotein
MKSVFVALLGLTLMSLAAAGCSSTAPAPATPAAAKPAAPAAEQKAVEPAQPTAPVAAAEEKAPAEAAKEPDSSVTLKAVDEKTGKIVMLTLRPIHFDYDKYAIRPEDRPAIKYNAGELNREPNLKVMIEGHCDERGTTEYNLALGEHRAVAVLHALTASGVEKGRMKTISYGKERPLDPGHDEAAWAKNRRSIVRDSSAG